MQELPASGIANRGTGGRLPRWRGPLLFAALPALIAGLLLASLFTVDVTEYGAVTRFGRVVRVIHEPGLHLKAPFDRVIRLDRRWTFSRITKFGPRSSWIVATAESGICLLSGV